MLIVKKFGGSSVANAERINHVAQTIVNSYKEGNQVVVVLSAQGDTTDELIEKAKEINPNASKREMDMLLSTGEQQSVALMAMAINKLGYPAISLNAFQCNIQLQHIAMLELRIFQLKELITNLKRRTLLLLQVSRV